MHRFIGYLTGIPGFIDYYYTHSDGSVTTVGIFESRESAEQSNKVAAEFVEKYLSGLYSGSPEIFEGKYCSIV